MRSLLVRLMIYFALAAAAVIVLTAFHHSGIAVLTVVIFTYLSVLILVMAVMLNYPRTPRQAMVHEFADHLESRNLLISNHFRADRAFRVEEFEEEGPHYFVELEGGGVLHLSGQYLRDYEPVEGSVRHFPCTEFTVRRHIEVGYVVDILCGGLVIEPEIEAPPFCAKEFAAHRVPEDGAILEGIVFDDLLHQRSGSAPTY